MVFGHSRSYIETMKRGAKPLLLIAGSLVLSATTDAITQDTTPYDSIVIRNVFNLKSPVVVPDDPIPPKDPPPTIELQGITTINGKKKVLFKVKASKPGEKDMSYILREGQGKDDVEVKLIDENTGSVQFDNHGTIQTLTMAENASKPSRAPVATVAGGIPSPMRNLPVRTIAATAGRGGSVTTIGGGQPGVRQIPSARTPRTSPAAAGLGAGKTATAKKSTQPQISRDEQTVLIEVDRELNKEKIAAGEYPPPPPTELTPEDAVGMPPPIPQ
jgi:hypothetical protein